MLALATLLLVIVQLIFIGEANGVKPRVSYLDTYEKGHVSSTLRNIYAEKVSPNRTNRTNRVDNHSTSSHLIYVATESYIPFTRASFNHCRHKNCLVKGYDPLKFDANADLVIFDIIRVRKETLDGIHVPYEQRRNQIWIAFGKESPGYEHHRWSSSKVDNRFNATMSYRSDSTLYFYYGKLRHLPNEQRSHPKTNYAAMKSKAAYAYVSNCNARYDRLATIKEIGKYIDVDLWGKCGDEPPCSRANFSCETQTHQEYRFYIGFENSLCKEYISEKVINRLVSKSMVVPIALGGLSVDEYERLLPPDSFLHVYNFTNIEALGKYLQKLLTDDEAYNRYHQWRGEYVRDPYPLRGEMACELCRLAAVKPKLPAIRNLSSWWNNDTCKGFERV